MSTHIRIVFIKGHIVMTNEVDTYLINMIRSGTVRSLLVLVLALVLALVLVLSPLVLVLSLVRIPVNRSKVTPITSKRNLQRIRRYHYSGPILPHYVWIVLFWFDKKGGGKWSRCSSNSVHILS